MKKKRQNKKFVRMLSRLIRHNTKQNLLRRELAYKTIFRKD